MIDYFSEFVDTFFLSDEHVRTIFNILYYYSHAKKKMYVGHFKVELNLKCEPNILIKEDETSGICQNHIVIVCVV